MTDIKWTLEEIAISKLRANDRNPRYIDKEQAVHLGALIDKFGLIDKPIVNADYQLIGGHQRVKILKKKKIKKVECWIASRLLDEKEIDHLTIGLNKNQGCWDFDILANAWDVGDLLSYGFTEAQLLDECTESEEKVSKEKKSKECKSSTQCPACGFDF